VFKFLRRDEAVRVEAVGRDILEDCIHPGIMFALFLAKGMNGTIQLSTTLADKIT
jgi:hypothetical protein